MANDNPPQGPQGPAKTTEAERAPSNGESIRSRLRVLETGLADLKGEWRLAKWGIALAVVIGLAYCNPPMTTGVQSPNETQGQ